MNGSSATNRAEKVVEADEVMAVQLTGTGGGGMPPRMSKADWHRIWWQIAALLAVSAIAVYAGTAFEDELERFMPESRMLASTYNKKPSGLSGLFDLTNNTGKTGRRWEAPYRQLSARGSLVVIAPTESLRDFEAEQILKWVDQGNQLIYFDDFTYEMTRMILAKMKLGKPKVVTGSNHKVTENFVAPAPGIAEFDHVKWLRLGSAVRLRGGEILAEDKAGAFIIMVKHGKGRVILGSVPDFLANKSIAKKEYWGNFQVFQNWLSTTGGTVMFDERSHGFSGGTNVFVYLSRGPVGLVVLQLTLILLIAIVSETRRFGSARSVDRRRKISNLEFINGLSNAYRRARANPAVLEILFHSFRNKLSRTLGVSPHEPLERLMEAWSQSRHASSFDLQGLLKQYEAFMSRREVSDNDLKTMIASCDKINENTQE